MSKNIHRLGRPKPQKKAHRRPSLPPVPVTTKSPQVTIVIPKADYSAPVSAPKELEAPDITELTDTPIESEAPLVEKTFVKAFYPPAKDEKPKPKRRRRQPRDKPTAERAPEEPAHKALNTPAAED